MKLPSSITLCEVGLRDGLQNEATLLTVRQKVALLLGLIDAGFKVIEVGSFMHSKAVPQMANTDEVYKAIGDIPGVELRALIPNLRGITRTIDCRCKKVNCAPQPYAQLKEPEHDAGTERRWIRLLCGSSKGKRNRNLRFHLHAVCLPVGRKNSR